MKIAARAIFVLAVLFAALSLSAYGIAAAAPSSTVGQFLQGMGLASSAQTLSDGSSSTETPEVTETPEPASTEIEDTAEPTETPDIEETPEATETPDLEDDDSQIDQNDDSQDNTQIDDSSDQQQTDTEDSSDSQQSDDQSEDGSSSILQGITAWVTTNWIG